MAHMKSWHVVVLQGANIVLDRETFSVGDSRTIFAEVKEKYTALNEAMQTEALVTGTVPKLFAIKREWY